MSIANETSAPQFTLLDTPLVGLEDIQRAAFYVFFEGMQKALDQIQAYWDYRDEIFVERTGIELAKTILEPIPDQNFHEGHKPSLIKGMPEDYPNLAVFATQATPAAESDRFDQMDSWQDSVLVEIMVKAAGDDDAGYTAEEIVNRRCHRTAEAVVLCLRRNINLGGAVRGIMTAPSISLGDVFAVRSTSEGGGYQGQGGSGSRYIWQGASIQFRVQKDSVLPSSGGGTFADSSRVDYGQFIDQG
jgi:hypothetical protein